MKELNLLETKLAHIEEVLKQYKLDYAMVDSLGPCIAKFTHTIVEGESISISTLISDEEEYLDKFEQRENTLIVGTSFAKERADASYKQAEQSSMLYNLSVSSIVNLCGGILILIFFIGKESGLSIKGAKATGVKAPGKKASGMKALGKKASGMKAPAIKAPAIKTPAIKAPAIKTPAIKAPAIKTPAIKAPASN